MPFLRLQTQQIYGSRVQDPIDHRLPPTSLTAPSVLLDLGHFNDGSTGRLELRCNKNISRSEMYCYRYMTTNRKMVTQFAQLISFD